MQPFFLCIIFSCLQNIILLSHREIRDILRKEVIRYFCLIRRATLSCRVWFGAHWRRHRQL